MDAVLLASPAALIGRLALGAIFFVAGWGKLHAGVDQFQAALLGYEMLPRRIVPHVARWLPRLEVVTALLVIAGVSPLPLYVTAFLLVVFSAAVTIALIRGKRTACGCFGRRDVRPLQRTIVARNLALLVLAVLLIAPSCR